MATFVTHMNKIIRLSVRITKELKERLKAACSRVKLGEAAMVEQCIESFCDVVERDGHVILPLSINRSTDAVKANAPTERVHIRRSPAAKHYTGKETELGKS